MHHSCTMSNQYTAESVASMTTAEAAKLGVEQYRSGKTFAASNVRPAGFLRACFEANRTDLIKALDKGWHIANFAEPVKLPDGSVIGSASAEKQLEAICNA